MLYNIKKNKLIWHSMTSIGDGFLFSPGGGNIKNGTFQEVYNAHVDAYVDGLSNSETKTDVP